MPQERLKGVSKASGRLPSLLGRSLGQEAEPLREQLVPMTAPSVARSLRIEIGGSLDVCTAQLPIAGPLVNEPAGVVFRMTEVHEVPLICRLEDGVTCVRPMREQVDEPAIARFFEHVVVDARVSTMRAIERVVEVPGDGVGCIQATVLEHAEELAREEHLVQSEHPRERQAAPA